MNSPDFGFPKFRNTSWEVHMEHIHFVHLEKLKTLRQSPASYPISPRVAQRSNVSKPPTYETETRSPRIDCQIVQLLLDQVATTWTSTPVASYTTDVSKANNLHDDGNTTNRKTLEYLLDMWTYQLRFVRGPSGPDATSFEDIDGVTLKKGYHTGTVIYFAMTSTGSNKSNSWVRHFNQSPQP